QASGCSPYHEAANSARITLLAALARKRTRFSIGVSRSIARARSMSAAMKLAAPGLLYGTAASGGRLAGAAPYDVIHTSRLRAQPDSGCAASKTGRWL